MTLLKFVLSCDMFWGYSMMLDPDWFNSTESIVRCVHVNLQTFLRLNGFDVLPERCKCMNLTLHESSLQELSRLPNNHTVYICDHP